MKFLRLAVTTLRLAMMRIGPGWMFGLLTFNFNRIAVHDLGALAIIVASLVGLHHFLSPLQVFLGHLTDRYPLFGYRRSPAILASGLLGALVFLMLPRLALELGNHSSVLEQWAHGVARWVGRDSSASAFPPLASLIPSLGVVMLAFGLFVLFGVAIAANGNSAAALVAEVVEEQQRGPVFVVVWLSMIFTSIASAGIAKTVLPAYDPQMMQTLYNLTLPIVLVSTLVGLVGMERRISHEEHAALMNQPGEEARAGGSFTLFRHLLKTNPHIASFFFFLLLSIFGIFLQDAILEIFGAEVFGMSLKETTSFTQSWGGGMLVGIVLILVVVRFSPIPRKTIATLGGLGIALSLSLIAMSALTRTPSFVTPGLFLFGVSTGLFNVGALSLMIDMSVEGYTGFYMGMWGLAQGLGNGLANVVSGGFHTLFIRQGVLSPPLAYGIIYGFEAMVMVLAVVVLQGLSLHDFKKLSTNDIETALTFETAT
ncbi:MAG: BCD family MFS transporter [Chloroflexaceae bacterium]|nr:BCD family MFS transporter [Chloroflexaceae bacterium]